MLWITILFRNTHIKGILNVARTARSKTAKQTVCPSSPRCNDVFDANTFPTINYRKITSKMQEESRRLAKFFCVYFLLFLQTQFPVIHHIILCFRLNASALTAEGPKIQLTAGAALPGTVCGSLIVLRRCIIALRCRIVALSSCITGRIAHGLFPFCHSRLPFCQFLFLKGVGKDIFPKCAGQVAEEIYKPLWIIVLIISLQI